MGRRNNSRLDAIIIGGGPAGLSAAMVLARSCRSVLVLDAGKPRNYAARHMHNYLSRDGVAPATFLEHARQELVRYGTGFERVRVVGVCPSGDGFDVRDERKRVFKSRVLLLATGVTDRLPKISNIEQFYGLGVHHCPYCDGWEYRGRLIAAFGTPQHALGLAMSLRSWSSRVVALTNGAPMNAALRSKAASLGIGVRTERVEMLRSIKGRDLATEKDPLGSVEFQTGERLDVAAMFFNTGQAQRSELPLTLGCVMNSRGGILRDRKQSTGVPGLYLAGDASRDVQFVVVAAAEGAKAGVAMNHELQERDRAEVLRPLAPRRDRAPVTTARAKSPTSGRRQRRRT